MRINSTQLNSKHAYIYSTHCTRSPHISSTQLNPAQFNATHSNPIHPSPPQPNPTQSNPTQLPPLPLAGDKRADFRFGKLRRQGQTRDTPLGRLGLGRHVIFVALGLGRHRDFAAEFTVVFGYSRGLMMMIGWLVELRLELGYGG